MAYHFHLTYCKGSSSYGVAEGKGCKLGEWWSWKVRKARNKRDKGTVATEFKTCLAWFGAHVKFLN